MRHALVLAGGSGTRLWPYSRSGVPKQLAPLFGDRSLLDLAVERAAAAVDAEHVWLAAGEQLRGQVTQVPAERLVLEPSGRDTLPALVLAMSTIGAEDPDAVVAVLTADHLIEPVAAFATTLAQGFALAESHDDVLVTFGVVPDHASTAFGYLELGAPLDGAALVVARFAEKPQRARAEQLLEQGALWNSGMFVWQAATFLRAAAAFAPDTLALVQRVREGEPAAWDEVPRVSVDYGVMEPASASEAFTVAALPLVARWLDVGSWPQYGDAVGRDAQGNALGGGLTAVLDSTDCVVTSSDPEHLVALVGCSGLVVVHTPGATLVVPADQAQRVKELHALVATEHPELS
ncbi:MAG TPA: mannose-1-phosphate guanylyltransferase [Mycobacteriales bacterium]|nr:mannose-1-phosphate guanylyltransferase [Mycobacteriales bacterium]